MPHSLMPLVVQVVVTCAIVVVLGVHVHHLVLVRGEARGWHSVHVLTALGMLDMSLPGGVVPVPMALLQLVFAVLSAVVLTVAVMRWAGARPQAPGSPSPGPGSSGLLWSVTAGGALGMLLMSSIPVRPSLAWQVAAVAATTWFVADAVAWASGVPVPASRHLGGAGGEGRAGFDDPGTPALRGQPLDSRHDGAAVDDRARSQAAVRVAATPLVHRVDRVDRVDHGGGGHHDLTLRMSLGAMAMAMAYLVVAMTFGMTDTDPSGGGGHLPVMQHASAQPPDPARPDVTDL